MVHITGLLNDGYGKRFTACGRWSWTKLNNWTKFCVLFFFFWLEWLDLIFQRSMRLSPVQKPNWWRSWNQLEMIIQAHEYEELRGNLEDCRSSSPPLKVWSYQSYTYTYLTSTRSVILRVPPIRKITVTMEK